MRRGAFSLTELLVVIAILGVLAALLFPVFANSKERGKISNCQAQLRQAGLGIALYEADHDSHGWLIYSTSEGGFTTAGRWKYPWNTWEPGAAYIKDSRLIWCPSPARDEMTTFNLYEYRTLIPPREYAPGDQRIRYPLDSGAGRVVATCSNHATKELERPEPKKANFKIFSKGPYTIVREDGSTQLIDSSKIALWYLWQDGTYHPEEEGTRVSSQVWRFPGEAWPPSIAAF